MGYSNSTGDDVMCIGTTSAAANSEFYFDNIVRITKLGVHPNAMITTPVSAKLNTSATKASNQSADKTTTPDTTASMYVSFSSTPPNITATSALIDFSVYLVP